MKKYCLGIDIGGTSIKSGLFDRQGVLLEKWSIPTRIEENGKHIIGDIKNSTDRKLESLGLDPGQLSGAGVGVPGQVSRQGEVLFAENLGWYHVPLTEELTRRLGMPVRTENDANLAALGEMWKGSGSRCSNLLFVTLGTGIGCGIVADGRILTGAAGAAGEIGHIHIEDRMTEKCNCGKSGCLEQLASGTGLRRMGEWALASSNEPSLLREGEVSARTIFEAAAAGDSLAVRVAEQFGEYLGKALAICTCVLNPQAVLIGGGVSKAGEIVLDYIRKHYRKYAYPPCENTDFRLAALRGDAGIYGGARLMIEGGA